MKCRHARKLISRYMDNEFVPDEKAAFAFHIRDCAACRKELEETRAIHRMFVAAEKFSAPYGFAARVRANIEEKEPTWLQRLQGLRHCFLRTAEAALALAVIAIGLVSGNLLLEDKRPVHRLETVQESFSLGLFQAAPPDSVGGIYLAYVGGTR